MEPNQNALSIMDPGTNPLPTAAALPDVKK